MILEIRAAPPFFKNGFVVGCEDTREAVVIDPGDEVGELLAAVNRHKLHVRYILLTHAHIDHVGQTNTSSLGGITAPATSGAAHPAHKTRDG